MRSRGDEEKDTSPAQEHKSTIRTRDAPLSRLTGTFHPPATIFIFTPLTVPLAWKMLGLIKLQESPQPGDYFFRHQPLNYPVNQRSPGANLMDINSLHQAENL